MNADNERVPDLLVELYALGELGPEQAREIEKRLENEEGGLERVEAIRRSNEEILDEYPVRVMSRRIERLAELEADRAQSSPYDAARPRRSRLVMAAAALLLCGTAVALVLSYDSTGGGMASAPDRGDQGGVIEDVFGTDEEESANGEGEDSERAWRNARAKKLKAKLERGKKVSEEDEDTTGLIRAMERKATRAKERGDIAEMVETCEAAREIDEGACDWLEGTLDRVENEGIEGDSADAGSADPSLGKELWQEGTKSLLKGDFRSAVENCERGLALGEERCNRVLGIAYKELGDEAKACEHLRAVGVTSYQGLACD